ncbi:MAG: hypothetical protein JSW14_07470 [Candidatus Bathyarchaeum sp.]|nr:MAG: hypothetical protein JSW14_07470 [Candidatus Bathyarchaeum sp.]
MVVREVFEVLYSPVKAFRKIIEKPDFKGVILVLGLVISSMIVVQYVASSKLFLENRMPENDDWTESLTNQHNWLANGSPSIDGTDYKMGNSDGNHSIISSIPNEASIWMKLTDIGPLNSSEETGYTELFFWIKWTHEEESSPNSGTLKLFSGSEDSYFDTDITSFLASNGEWANATFNIGPEQGWTPTNSPDWQSITGLEFSLDWSASANLTMKIDGLFFRKYVSFIELGGFGGVIQVALINLALPFVINLILWSGILIIVGKLFQEDLGKWSVFFVIFGYAFIATFVYTIVNGLAISTLPPLNLPLDPTAANAAINELWTPLIAYQLSGYIPLIGEVWIAGLGAVVVRLMRETTWGKAATIAAVAFGIRFLLRMFLGL